MKKLWVLLLGGISLVAGNSPRGELLNNQAALGRHVNLGGLYNARNNKFVVGMSLWRYSTIEENKITKATRYSRDHYQFEDDVFDRMANFKIDADMKLAFLGGLIEVDGSANYLKSSKEVDTTVRFTLHFESKHRSERIETSLPIDEVNRSNCDLTGEDAPTHVVSEVTYGLNAVFIFEQDVHKNDSTEVIKGNLGVKVKSIPSFTIEGEATIDIDGNKTDESENTRIDFFGDILLESRQPSTLEEAAAVYKEIGKKALTDPQIVTYSLNPISYYCKKEDTILNEISSIIRDHAIKIIGEIQNTEMKVRTLKATDVAKRFTTIRKPLVNYENELTKFKTIFLTQLGKFLIKAKMDRSAQEDISKLIQNYTDSPFEEGRSQIRLSIIGREIDTIDLVTGNNIDKTYEVTDEEDANDNRCLFRHRFAIFYSLNVLDDGTDDHKSGQDRWFNNPVQIGHAGERFRAFLEFSKFNQVPECCFMVQLREHKQEPVNIVVYKDGEVFDNNFEIPQAPEQVTKIKTDFDHVQLGFKPIKNQDITGFIVKYRSLAYSSKNEWKQEEVIEDNNTDVHVNVDGLTPMTKYMMKLSFKTHVGVSPDSQEVEVKTLLSSPPSNVVFKSPNPSSLQVSFQPPSEIPPEIKNNITYIVTLKKGKDLKMKLEKAEKAPYIFTNLNPATHFYISVIATFRKEVFHGIYKNISVEYENYASLPATLKATTIPQTLQAPRYSSLLPYSATISWDTPEVASGAIINNFLVIYTRIDNKVEANRVTLDDVTYLELEDLDAGVLYEVTVQVQTTAGNSLKSAGKRFTTPYEETELDRFKNNLDLIISETRNQKSEIRNHAAMIRHEGDRIRSNEDLISMNKKACDAQIQQLETDLERKGNSLGKSVSEVAKTMQVFQPAINPDFVTVSRDNGPKRYGHSDKMGIYKRTEDYDGYPMWTDLNNNMNTIFSTGVHWMIGPRLVSNQNITDYIQTIVITGVPMPILPVTGWEVYSSGWTNDAHLTVTAGRPVYPESIQVSSEGPSNSSWSHTFGQYNKIPGLEQGGRPVYKNSRKQEKKKLFYSGKYWIIGEDIESSAGVIYSDKPGLLNIPETGWNYISDEWHLDPRLKFMSFA